MRPHALKYASLKYTFSLLTEKLTLSQMTNDFFESSSIRTFFHKTFESAIFQNDFV